MMKQSTKRPNRSVARWLAAAIVALGLTVPLSASADHRHDGWDVLAGVAIGYAIHDARHDYRRGHHRFHAKHRGWRSCNWAHFHGPRYRGRKFVRYDHGYYYDDYGYRYDGRGRYRGKRRHHRH